MVNDYKYFHFTIGPVQGFVAQARRTRDIWAGSFLLSYLSGKAMAAIVETECAEIVFPSIGNDSLFKAIRNPPSVGNDKNHPAARVGSLPNRFKAAASEPQKAAEAAQKAAQKAAEAAQKAIEEAWGKIEKAVWKRFQEWCLELISEETKDIWQRQVEASNLWEIAWVIGKDGSLLDRRKNMRSHFSQDEPGEKCTLCGERQALSKTSSSSRSELKDWWGKVAEKFNEAPKNKGFHFWDEGRERLCAVCTIKRIFPLVAKEAIGWETYSNYPSTAYMSALDWLKVVLEKAEAETDDGGVCKSLTEFIEYSKHLKVPLDEQGTVNQIPWLREFVKRDKGKGWKEILQFRGDVFFPDSIKNKRDFPINSKDDDDDEGKRKNLLDKLKKLTQTAGLQPNPFYAILLMDGDNMGKLLSSYENEQPKISQALADFTAQVDKIVEEEHDGKLIYAGGDDVFAFLPLSTALACAKKLKERYETAFGIHASKVAGATISAGIVYAHMNTALRAVIRDVHELLDKTAKDGMDRNAFAVRVWKRGGPILTFGKKWQNNGSDWVCNTTALRNALLRNEYSKGFIYRLIELIPILNELKDDEERVALLTAEYLKSREKLGLSEERGKKIREAKERVRNLLLLAKNEKEEIAADGPLFIRFLAGKEV